MDGSTQSERPAAMTMTGSTKAAASSMMVARVTEPLDPPGLGPAGRGAVPAVTLIA